MNTPLYRDCSGCGVRLPQSEAYRDGRYHTSAECWQLYGEVTSYTLTRGDKDFIHQLAVDTYAAQHVLEQGKPISPAFALIGLYYACEHDYSGRQVQHLHMLLAQRSKTWPRFLPPANVGPMTVLDVVQAQPGAERDAALRRWAQAVWSAWSQEHEQVKALATRFLAE